MINLKANISLVGKTFDAAEDREKVKKRKEKKKLKAPRCYFI